MYIGDGVTLGGNQIGGGGNLETELFTSDGANLAFITTNNIATAESILVTIDGVLQYANEAYTVSGNTITFASAPGVSYANNIQVIFLGISIGINVPATSSVTYNTLSTDVKQLIGRRNIIINGDMRIDQRFDGAVSQYQGNGATALFIDRMSTNNTGLSQCDRQQVAGFGGFTNAAQITTVTAESDFSAAIYNHGLRTTIEGYDCQAMKDKPITTSFWFKASKIGQYSVSFRATNYTNSYVSSFNYTDADTPQKIEINVANFPGNYISENTTGAGISVAIGFLNTGQYETANANQWQSGIFLTLPGNVNWMQTIGDYIAVTGWQLEVGTVATEFEQRSYGEELALCQRYYVVSTHQKYGYESYPGRGAIDNNSATCEYAFPVKMRVIPTLSYTVSGTLGTITAASVYGFKPRSSLSLASPSQFYGYTANAEI